MFNRFFRRCRLAAFPPVFLAFQVALFGFCPVLISLVSHQIVRLADGTFDLSDPTASSPIRD